MNMTIGCWNVLTLLDTYSENRPESALLEKELNRYNIDIAALAETCLANEG